MGPREQCWEGRPVNMRAACLSVDRYLDGFEQGCPGVLPDSDTLIIRVVGGLPSQAGLQESF